jgi:peptide/nickel transport system ATP-binding protein
MGVVADLADHVAVMRRGEVVEAGPTLQIFREPKHPYTIALLDAVPHLGQGAGGEEIDVTVALAAAALAEDEAPTGLLRQIEVNERALQEAHEVARELDARERVLEFKNIVIEYPGHGRVKAFRAIDGVDLTVHKGEVMGLVGESGSGKTTLGRAAIGLLPVTSGELNVTGVNLSTWNRKRVRQVHKNAGIVFQDPASSLNPRMTIGQSIGEPLLLAKGLKGRALDKEVQALLDSVELPSSYKSRYPHELSGGQKQRVGIARAISLHPDLLIADEPTSALDVSVQATVLDLIKNLQAQFQFACLFVTHDLAVIDVLADRIAVMHLGRLAEVGTRDEILRNPQDPYTQRLIAAVPLPDPEVQRERRELRARILAAGSDEYNSEALHPDAVEYGQPQRYPAAEGYNGGGEDPESDEDQRPND